MIYLQYASMPPFNHYINASKKFPKTCVGGLLAIFHLHARFLGWLFTMLLHQKRNNNCSIQRNNRCAKGTTIVSFKGTTSVQKGTKIVPFKGTVGVQKEKQLLCSKE
jgi:hypothetical protein